MSPEPLGVRLRTSRREIHVTAETGGVQYASSIPGGFRDAKVRLARPLRVQAEELQHYAQVCVYDTGSGATAWEGHIADLGRTVDADGMIWEIIAAGSSAHVYDRKTPTVFIDQTTDHAYKTSNSRKWGELSQDTGPLSQDLGVKLFAPRGTQWNVGDYVAAILVRVAECGQDLASVNWNWECGGNSINWHIQMFTFPTNFQATDDLLQNSSVINTRAVIDTDFPVTDNTVYFRLYRDGTNVNPGDDLAWVIFSTVIIRAVLFTRFGVPREDPSDYPDDWVTSDEVVNDQIGRFLNKYDPNTAVVTPGAYAIEQLSYPDGATPGDIFSDLMKLDPYYWAAWELQDNGLARFEWVPFPSIVTYEAGIQDGFDGPSSATELLNRVHVRGKDANGRIRVLTVTATSPILSAAGRTRSDALDLGDELFTANNATRAGQQYLATRTVPANGGKIVFRRPILDVVGGRMVPPHMIRPGKLIRLRDVPPHRDALNATARDGNTVFLIVTVDYSDGAATCELDVYADDLARQLASLRNTPLTGARRR